ncbi:MAG: hypothetical protein EB101_02205 [Chitinophagia bacterium]|nr:hypothetical protein [Chitinophagia bacterium]
MRKLFLAVLLASTLLTGCLDNTQEITLNENGGGLFSASTDMGDLLGLVRQMGAAQDLSGLEKQKLDTVILLADAADSLEGLTSEEKALVGKASLALNMDLSTDKMKTGIRMPFDHPGQAAIIQPLSGKLLGDVARRQLDGKLPTGGRQMPAPSSFEAYYDLTIEKGSIRRVLNKERYARAEEDEFLKGMRELSGMGLSMKSTYVINLPRPATKAEGKSLKLSEDKRKITLSVDIDDFFDEPEKLQYLIEF